MKSYGPVYVRVITHNIRYATNSPFKGEELWSIRRPRMVNELRFNTSHCPEAIIGLQEVLHEQLVDILSLLNHGSKEWSSIGVGRDDGQKAGEYSPILYRSEIWHLVDSKTVWLSETPQKPSKSWDAACTRILTVAKFQHRQTKKQMIVMNTHLDDQGSRSRLEAAKIIAEQVETMSHEPGRPDIPTVLAGDFNSEPGMEAYRYMKEETPMADVQTLVAEDMRYGHQNTFTGFGYEELPLKRIDFIFIKTPKKDHLQGTEDSWIVKSYAVLENQFDDGVYNSDHRAVVADLELQ